MRRIGSLLSITLLATACPQNGEEPVGPTAVFSWAPLCDLVPAASFNANASSPGDAPIVEYSWLFGDAWGSDLAATEHRFEGSGPFSVSLTVTDEEGREDTHTEPIDLRQCLEVVSIGTDLAVTQLTARADIHNVSGDRKALVAFMLTILDTTGEPWMTEIDGGQHEIDVDQTVTVGGIDWRDCETECDRAGDVEIRVTSTYWAE